MALKQITAFSTETEGVKHKPDLCKLCPMAAIGQGFVPDYVPKNPLIAFAFDMPTGDAVLDQDPMAGAQGYVWNKILIDDLGYSKNDVLVSHIIRCKQPNDVYGRPKYPTGFVQKPAELNCRQYDEAIIAFDPNVFVLTLHPRDIRAVGCHQIQIQRDVKKALGFVEKGYRPLVLFGQGAMELYFPYLKNNGGSKTWRGHWWCGESPFKDNEKNQKKIGAKQFVKG